MGIGEAWGGGGPRDESVARARIVGAYSVVSVSITGASS